MDKIIYKYIVPGDDFTRAGSASADLKNNLKTLGIPSDKLRNISISLYEGEINLAIHANGGNITATIFPDKVELLLTDDGPGIADINLAMTEGYSSANQAVRSLGFGAGMGLPNMKKYSDEFFIESELGKGTSIKMIHNL